MGEGAEAEIKVRQLFELKDLGLRDAVELFRDIEARKKQALAPVTPAPEYIGEEHDRIRQLQL
jgi:hypothetical protein